MWYNSILEQTSKSPTKRTRVFSLRRQAFYTCWSGSEMASRWNLLLYASVSFLKASQSHQAHMKLSGILPQTVFQSFISALFLESSEYKPSGPYVRKLNQRQGFFLIYVLFFEVSPFKWCFNFEEFVPRPVVPFGVCHGRWWICWKRGYGGETVRWHTAGFSFKLVRKCLGLRLDVGTPQSKAILVKVAISTHPPL